jgi:hypothetical protein
MKPENGSICIVLSWLKCLRGAGFPGASREPKSTLQRGKQSFQLLEKEERVLYPIIRFSTTNASMSWYIGSIVLTK